VLSVDSFTGITKYNTCLLKNQAENGNLRRIPSPVFSERFTIVQGHKKINANYCFFFLKFFAFRLVFSSLRGILIGNKKSHKS